MDLDLGLSGPEEFVFLTIYYLEPLHNLCAKSVRFLPNDTLLPKHSCLTNSYMQVCGYLYIYIYIYIYVYIHIHLIDKLTFVK